MSKPADLLKNLKYDHKMDHLKSAHDYLKQCKEFSSSKAHERKISLEYGDADETYTLNIANVEYLDLPGFKWSGHSETWKLQSPALKSRALNNIRRAFANSSKVLSELESLLRYIPSQDVLKYDIPLITEYFNYYATMMLEIPDTQSVKERELLVFTGPTSLGLLGMAVSSAIAAGVSVTILATVDVAVVTQLFVKTCVDAGLPTDALSVCIVAISDLSKFVESGRSAFNEISYVFNSNIGCAVIVTESSDIDSAIDMLVSDATCTYVYPWRTDRLLVQESIYEEFRKRFETKLSCTASEELDDAKKCLPKGAEVWQYPKKYSDSVDQFVVSKNIQSKMTSITKMEPYRSTKELLSLLNNYSPFAISLWCNDVSVSNEISYAASVPIVWINTYGMFDASVPLKIRHKELTIFGGELGFSKHILVSKKSSPFNELSNDKDIKEQLKGHLNSLKKMLPSWGNLTYHQRLSVCLNTIEETEANYLEENSSYYLNTIAKNIRISASKAKSEIRVGKKLRIHIQEPVGVALVCADRDTTLVKAIVSVIEGNGVIYNEETKITTCPNLLNNLKINGVPIIFYQERAHLVLNEAVKIHEIKSTHDDRVHYDAASTLYNTKVIWSPIGETFAN